MLVSRVNEINTRCNHSSKSVLKTQQRRAAAPHRSTKISAFFNVQFTKPNVAKQSLNKILDLIEGTDRGLSTTNAQEIKSLFDEIDEMGGPQGTEKSITGTWKLVWTTEKETLFIIKNAFLFGTKAGDVYQVIDSSQGTLQNVIEFPPEGAFIVDSSVSWSGNGRSDFKFNNATIKLPNDRNITLPPVGEGWFRSIYCDDKYRLAKDVRGDYLLVKRDGPPRKFE